MIEVEYTKLFCPGLGVEGGGAIFFSFSCYSITTTRLGYCEASDQFSPEIIFNLLYNISSQGYCRQGWHG